MLLLLMMTPAPPYRSRVGLHCLQPHAGAAVAPPSADTHTLDVDPGLLTRPGMVHDVCLTVLPLCTAAHNTAQSRCSLCLRLVPTSQASWNPCKQAGAMRQLYGVRRRAGSGVPHQILEHASYQVLPCCMRPCRQFLLRSLRWQRAFIQAVVVDPTC
jgi:hypothetical protein